MGSSILPIFDLRVWVSELLCWSFLHTVSDFFYFCIFKVFAPKGQMDFNFEFFQNLGFLPCFACRPIFSSFLGTMWFVDLDDLFGYQSDHFCIFCCIGMHVASVLSILFLVEGLVTLCSLQVFLFDLCDGGAPHMSTCVYIVRWLESLNLLWYFQSSDHWGWVGKLHAYRH